MQIEMYLVVKTPMFVFVHVTMYKWLTIKDIMHSKTKPISVLLSL